MVIYSDVRGEKTKPIKANLPGFGLKPEALNPGGRTGFRIECGMTGGRICRGYFEKTKPICAGSHGHKLFYERVLWQ
jgi:hypothetical protein